MDVTWKPVHVAPGTPRSELPDSVFAFPHERKEPLTDGAHVRSAIARFAQVDGVTDRERAVAFANIKAAGHFFCVPIHAESWHDLVSSRAKRGDDEGTRRS